MTIAKSAAFGFTVLQLSISSACNAPPAGQSSPGSSTEQSSTALELPSPTSSASPVRSAVPEAKSTALAESETSAAEPPACPDGMQLITGGEFWSGSPGTRGPADEHPRFLTKLHSFCLDRTEVTVEAYTACETADQCTSAARRVKTCNGGRTTRNNHPINCTTWDQATAYCQAQGKRLPTELEWEYAARGGQEQRKFSWGSAHPDGKTCWKRPRTCEVGKYALGAFGLHDMNGNVWEWTDSFYGRYPWVPKSSPTKVYRGGSWSRRFEKWMSLTLRNRYGTDKWGSHLGFRCAQLAATTDCPYGPGKGGRCLHGVEDAECAPREKWNGVRCARTDSPSQKDGCAPGTQLEPGHGCVSNSLGGVRQQKKGKGEPAADIRTVRSPSFDADCRVHQPNRPKAYRLAGGTHHGRNLVGRSRGCKNRDVGVGWNSACCP